MADLNTDLNAGDHADDNTDAAADESPLDAAAEALGGDATTTEGLPSALPAVVPAWCDLLQIDPETIQARLDKGMNPIASYFRVWRRSGKDLQREWGPDRSGAFAIEDCTEDWLRENCGPGFFQVKAFNQQGQYLYSNRVTLDAAGFVQPTPGPGVPPSSPHNAAQAPPWVRPNTHQQGPESMEQLVMRTALQRMLDDTAGRSGGKDDPMRDALASVVKMMAASQTQQAQNAQLQMNMMQQQVQMWQQLTMTPQSDGGGSRVDQWLDKLLGAVLLQVKSAGNGNGGNGQGTFGELMGAMTFGMQLRNQFNGEDDEDKKFEKMLGIVPKVTDSIGPGVVAAMSQAFLSDEKAARVADMMSEHMKARQAEAEVEEEPIDTTGIPGGIPG
jgi:hypothetical protein